jgi:alkylhydroperoxidase family enzyme
MAILHPKDAATASPESLAIWERAGQKPEDVLHLVRLWAYSPWLQRDHQRLGDTLHNRTGVSRRLKEVAIVRACTKGFSRYELFHHIPLALASGLSEAEVAAIQSLDCEYNPDLGETEKAVVQYVDDVLGGRGVSAITFARLRSHVTAREALELALQGEYWYCNARFTRTLESPFEPNRDGGGGRAVYPSRPPSAAPVVDVPPPIDPPGRAILVDPLNAEGRPALWFERWRKRFGDVPALVRAWAANEHVQVAYQQAWEGMFERHTALPPEDVAAVALFAADANNSTHAASVVEQCAATGLGVNAAGSLANVSPRMVKALEFVEAWDAGVRLGDPEVSALLDLFSDSEVVEIQLVAGLVGGQARIANALRLT